MSEQQQRVSVNVDDAGVADVRLNRPEKMNALDTAMFVALAEAGDRLKEEPSVRAVVLSGEGRSFCAGLDFDGFRSMSDDDGDGAGAATPLFDTSDRITHLGQQAAFTWMELQVPVIAAITGHALGGGCQIALGADIRFIAPDAQMSVLEIRWGLTPDMTGTVTLSRLVGLDMAKELTWTGRSVSGTEAVQLGLATHVADDPHAAAMDLAHQIAANNPDAVQGAKALFNEADQLDLARSFAQERDVISGIIGTENQTEAVTAFFEKRPPSFTDPD